MTARSIFLSFQKMPDDFFSTYLAFGGGILAMIVMMVIGIPMYVCSAASVPIAAALIASMLAAVAGFGGAVIMLPVLVWAVGVEDAVPVLTIAQLGFLRDVVLPARLARQRADSFRASACLVHAHASYRLPDALHCGRGRRRHSSAAQAARASPAESHSAPAPQRSSATPKSQGDRPCSARPGNAIQPWRAP